LKETRERIYAAGSIDGRHYTEYVELVKQLKREQRLTEAESLLLELIDAVEAQALEGNGSIPPWYYEQLAIVYRKERRISEEVATLERYHRQVSLYDQQPREDLELRLIKASAKIRHKVKEEEN